MSPEPIYVATGLQPKDWLDSSSQVRDAPLQAAIQDGVVTFLHASNAAPELLAADGSKSPDQQDIDMGGAEEAAEGSRENCSPNAVCSIDDAACLELD